MITPQAPLHSGFGKTTTPKEVMGNIRLDGKTALVTGGYVGIGLETTRALALAGAKVVVPARSMEKARAALAGIPNVELEEMDLSVPKSVEAFAERFIASKTPLHLLIDNAGIMAIPFSKSVDGFELQLATNHLGHFRLTAKLWPALRQAKGARVVVLTSSGHRFGAPDLEDPNFEKTPYDKWQAYGRSKSANALFALTLDDRGKEYGVRAFSVHPGSVESELTRSLTEEELNAARARVGQTGPFLRKKADAGASTSLWCAVSPALEGKGGVYCEDVDVAQPVAPDHAPMAGARPWILDRALGEKVWAATEKWTGAPFTL